MKIGRGKLALIGERGKRLDFLQRERRVARYSRSGWMPGEWLRVPNIEVIKAARNELI